MQDNAQCPYPSDCLLTETLRERAMQRNRPIERSPAWQTALLHAAKVQLLLLDVDGVLTDGGILYTSRGDEIKAFHAQDGLGLKLLQEVGIEVGLITARSSEALSRRAAELGLRHIYQDKRDKLTIYEAILKETGLRPLQTAYMGDDWLDLPILNRAGLAAAPANAVPEVCRRVHYLTERHGGAGAVREVCDLILASQGKTEQVLARFDR